MRFRLLGLGLGLLALVAMSTPAATAGASPTPRQVVLNAVKATKTAAAFRVQGVITERAKASAPEQRVTLDVSASRSGTGQGTIGIDKGTAKVREVAGTVYFNANAAFWLAEGGGSSAANVLAGRWVSTAATSATGASLADFLDSSSFLTSIFGTSLLRSTFTSAGSATVSGRHATGIAVTYKKDDAHGDIYVASSGPAYILKLAVVSEDGAATLSFSDFNQAINPVAPVGAINLDTLSS